MSIVADTSVTISTILQTVNVTAQRVATVVNAAGDGVDMLGKYIRDAKQKQEADSEFDMEDYAMVARLRHQEVVSRTVTEIEQRVKADKDLQANWNKLNARYDAIQDRIEKRLRGEQK